MNRKFLPVAIAVTIAFFSCQHRTPTQPQDSPRSAISISFLSKDTPPEVAEIVGFLSRPGYDTLRSEFSISSGLARCEFDDLQSGNWHLRVEALNAQNVLLYAGETDVAVVAGVTVPVSLHLDPATGSIDVTVTWGDSSTTGANNALQFGGDGGSVLIPPSPDFHLQELTVEMYVQVNNLDTIMVPFLYETGLDQHSQADGFSVKWEQGLLYFRIAVQSNTADGVSKPYSFRRLSTPRT